MATTQINSLQDRIENRQIGYCPSKMNDLKNSHCEGEVVVIDDTPANLRLLTQLLGEWGYQVRPFPSGKLALQGLQSMSPDLILLDIQMPNMDGYEVCKQLKAETNTCDIPVLFISALNETLDKVKAFDLGGVDYITKPFHTQEVLARVATHIKLGRMQKKLQLTNTSQSQELEQKNHEFQQVNQVLEQANQEIKLQYQELQQAQLKLVKSEKMSTLGNLVAGIAHEINNPVGCITGNLQPTREYLQDLLSLIDLYQQKYPQPDWEIQEKIEAIELDFLRQDAPKLIASMQVGADRIKNISTSLRTFSRADKDYKVPFNLHEGINSTLLILKHRLKSNDFRPAIEVVQEYNDLPEVQCYPGQLNQVFMNLIANAIDALEEASKDRSYTEILANPNRIKIQTLQQENTVIVKIQDNGIGMTEAVRSQIFKQSFTTKAVGKGTGLGLAIARQIIDEKHGGHLTCQSQPGESTEFTIQIPVE